MADTNRYQVVSACAIVPIVTSDGRYIHTLYQGGVFQADPNDPKIVHNVESGYIAAIGVKADSGLDAAGAVMLDNKRVDGEDAGTPVELNDPGVVNEAQQGRSAAAAKLPTDGSAPDGRAAKEVHAEWLARNGYDYAEVMKQDPAEIKKLVKQQSQPS